MMKELAEDEARETCLNCGYRRFEHRDDVCPQMNFPFDGYDNVISMFRGAEREGA
jgi:hypothetical protein